MPRARRYFKGVQSAGAGLAWMIDALGVDFGPQLLICVGWNVLCAPLTIYLATKDTDRTEDSREGEAPSTSQKV